MVLCGRKRGGGRTTLRGTRALSQREMEEQDETEERSSSFSRKANDLMEHALVAANGHVCLN